MNANYPAYETPDERARYHRWHALAYGPSAGNRVWDLMHESDRETNAAKAHWPAVEVVKRLGEPDWVRVVIDGVVQVEGQVNTNLTVGALPEGRADEVALGWRERLIQEFGFRWADATNDRDPYRQGFSRAVKEVSIIIREWEDDPPAAPVVAVPEAGEDDYTDEEYEALSEDEQNAWLARRLVAEGLVPAPTPGAAVCHECGADDAHCIHRTAPVVGEREEQP